jgi:3-phenylpropionate/cinnamic acid dioxygenase small subunit
MPSITEDRDEILQLLYRYNHAIDSGDARGWANTFTEDGVFDVGGQVMSGRDELVKFASDVHGLRHMVVNPLVDVAGDAATVRAYFVVFQGTAPLVVGTYEDEVVRTPEGWRFAKRVSKLDNAS